jgi:hypothetical protein
MPVLSISVNNGGAEVVFVLQEKKKRMTTNDQHNFPAEIFDV